MQATIVFEKTWEAINAKKTDGSRKYKYIIHTGSSRSSKTYSILQTHWLICLTQPNTRVSIWRETKADCKMTILADLKKAVPTFPNNEIVTFNKTESIYTFPNGSTIEFMGGDEENRVHGFQGNVAHLNEPYKFGEDAFNQIDMRTSNYVIIDWNPKSKHFIDDVSKRDNAIVIHSTYKDNPFCPIEQRLKIESYLSVKYTDVVENNLISYQDAYSYNFDTNVLKFTDKQLKELKRALHNESQNTANDYLHLVYARGLKAEKPNRIFRNWQQMEDKAFYDLPYQSYYATDFGLSAPTANIEFKFDGDKTFFFHQRLYKPMNKMESTLSDEFEKLGTIKHKENICDSGNELNKAEGTKLRNSGYNVIFAQKGHGSINAGIETLQKCNVYYTKSSIDLENEYENYSWKMYQGIQMDVPEDNQNDHALDCCRMGASWYVKTRGLSI
jgi:phage terminase large subunit